MTPEKPTSDPLDELLRQGDAHVPDGGFTGRVMLSLPPCRANRLRRGVLFGAVLAGAILAACLAPMMMSLLPVSLHQAAQGQGTGWLVLGAAVAGLGLLIWGLVSVALDEV